MHDLNTIYTSYYEIIILYHLIPKNPKHAFVGHKEIIYAWVKWMFLPFPTSTHIIPRLCWSQHPGFLVIKTVEDLTNSFHLAFHICETKTKKKQPTSDWPVRTTSIKTFNLARHLHLAVTSKFSCGPNAILPEFILSQPNMKKDIRRNPK